MKQTKSSIKPLRNAHTANTKYGMGDHYGTGVKNPTGRVIEGIGHSIPKAKLRNPPKSLA